jgi:multidrug efflux pump subunit AcrA (membrane-fusion protein)
MKRSGIILLSLIGLAGIAGAVTWGVRQFLATMTQQPGKEIPTTTVRKGQVTISVSARGDLQGGNSEMMLVPPTGSSDVPITYLRPTGDMVKAGDTIVEFDTTQQEYNLREAEADLAEAEQKVTQAQAETAAALEEARYTTLSTVADLEIAELEARKNPILAVNAARQNDINVAAARNRKEQADRDYKNRLDSANASVNMQRANQNKFKMLADNARRTIDNMVLKSKTGGYVHVLSNSNGQLLYTGAVVPDFQIGDTARTGQTIVQIPDMSTWEVNASVPELDRGYIAVGQKAEVRAAVLGGRTLRGHVKSLGGTTGMAASRRFDCRILLDQTDPALRPGMTTNVVITVATLDDVLWLPSQAVFESDNRSFVYVNGPKGFVQQDIKLLRRGESQAVISGLAEGTRVALSPPDQETKSDAGKGNSVMKALTK